MVRRATRFKILIVRRMETEFEARGQQRFMSPEVVRATRAGKERQIAHAQATVGAQGADTSGQHAAATEPTAGVVAVAPPDEWRRQTNSQRGIPSTRPEAAGHRRASRAGRLSREHLRGVEPASRAAAMSRRRRNEVRQPRRSPAR